MENVITAMSQVMSELKSLTLQLNRPADMAIVSQDCVKLASLQHKPLLSVMQWAVKKYKEDGGWL